MSKDKKTSAFSASSLVADALKLKKEKPSIGAILERQNEQLIRDDRDVKTLSYDLNENIEKGQEDSRVVEALSLKKNASSNENIDQTLTQDNISKNQNSSTKSDGVLQKKENTLGIINSADNVKTKNFTDLNVNALENISAKKRKQSSSLDRYLVPNKNVQKGKAVYVRTDYHTKIEKIINSIGGKGLTLAAYIDNILTVHFEEFNEEISKKQQEALLAELETFNKK